MEKNRLRPGDKCWIEFGYSFGNIFLEGIVNQPGEEFAASPVVLPPLRARMFSIKEHSRRIVPYDQRPSSERVKEFSPLQCQIYQLLGFVNSIVYKYLYGAN